MELQMAINNESEHLCVWRGVTFFAAHIVDITETCDEPCLLIYKKDDDAVNVKIRRENDESRYFSLDHPEDFHFTCTAAELGFSAAELREMLQRCAPAQ